jgi:ubiquinone/menaquinone biosynthesis C-methylase UbiE
MSEDTGNRTALNARQDHVPLLRRWSLKILARIDHLWLATREFKNRQRAVKPTAGAGVQSTGVPKVDESNGLAWPNFSTLAHSFWRSQELTLFRRHQDLMSEPCFDLGSGDSIFAAMAGFPKKRIGLDYDAGSLEAALGIAPDVLHVRGDAGRLPFAANSLASCLSNSVLEHLPNLDACFAEVHRVLRPGGVFVFSATLGGFTGHLRELTGEKDANYWIERFGHTQQPSLTDLCAKLEKVGFQIRKRVPYQPVSASALYRFYASPAIQFLERRLTSFFQGRPRRSLERHSAQSIAGETANPACVFIVAEK